MCFFTLSCNQPYMFILYGYVYFFLQCHFCPLVFLNFKLVNVKSFNSIYINLFIFFYYLVNLLLFKEHFIYS